jgi:hypothetical protein
MRVFIPTLVVCSFLASTCEAFVPKTQHSRVNLVEVSAKQSNDLDAARRSMIANSFGLGVLSLLPVVSEAKEFKVSYLSFSLILT